MTTSGFDPLTLSVPHPSSYSRALANLQTLRGRVCGLGFPRHHDAPADPRRSQPQLFTDVAAAAVSARARPETAAAAGRRRRHCRCSREVNAAPEPAAEAEGAGYSELEVRLRGEEALHVRLADGHLLVRWSRHEKRREGEQKHAAVTDGARSPYRRIELAEVSSKDMK